jgi:DNA-binding NarL/FixJ family response regulator
MPTSNSPPSKTLELRAGSARKPAAHQKGRTGDLIKKHIGDGAQPHIVVVGKQLLFAQCLAACLRTGLGAKTSTYPDLESWLGSTGMQVTQVVVCKLGEFGLFSDQRDTMLFSDVASRLPTVVIANAEDLDQVLLAIEAGARGYIPTSLSIDIVVEAVRLIAAGGVFVPASSVVTARGARYKPHANGRDAAPIFTARQTAVVRALCLGKPNKTIAHELNMRESTVKVHVRNIMKKLSAKNRTEVALIAKGLPL